MTNSYRCYFTDESDRIRSYELIECPDDAAAALKVDGLLATSKYSTAELWQGKRLVGKVGYRPSHDIDREDAEIQRAEIAGEKPDIRTGPE